MTNNERLNFLLRKSEGKRLMDEYLQELNSLITKSINRDNILTLEESDMILQNASKFKSSTNYIEEEIALRDKYSLGKTIKAIQDSYEDKVYIHLRQSEYCGLAEVDSIKLFNTEFEYNPEITSFIIIYDAEIENRLVIDFFENLGNIYYDLEVYGEQWLGSIRAP